MGNGLLARIVWRLWKGKAMAEYIEKQDIYDAIDLLMTRFPYKVPGRPDTYHPYNEAWASACSHALDLIRYHQPADVRPVVRGRWEMDSDGIPHCTECGYVAPQRLFLQVQSLACTTQFIMSNYCPDCGSCNGADMRGGDADGNTKD